MNVIDRTRSNKNVPTECPTVDTADDQRRPEVFVFRKLLSHLITN